MLAPEVRVGPVRKSLCRTPPTADAKTATPDAVALAREAAGRAIVLLQEREAPAAARCRRRSSRMAVIGTHARDTPIGGYSDVPRHVVSVLEGMQEAGEGPVRRRLCRRRADHREPLLVAATRSSSTPPRSNRKLIARGGADRAQGRRHRDGARRQRADQPRGLGRHPSRRPRLARPGRPAGRARPGDLRAAASRPSSCCSTAGRCRSIISPQRRRRCSRAGISARRPATRVADVLFGRVNPGGKLPVSIARSVGQLPVFYNHKPTARRGYLFDTTEPLYPFGYGLSYTSFDISAPRLADAGIARQPDGAGRASTSRTPAAAPATRSCSSTSTTMRRRSPGR